MSKTNLETRVTTLERQFSRFQKLIASCSEAKDWRSTFGLFADDPGFEEVVRLGRKIRRELNKDKSS